MSPQRAVNKLKNYAKEMLIGEDGTPAQNTIEAAMPTWITSEFEYYSRLQHIPLTAENEASRMHGCGGRADAPNG